MGPVLADGGKGASGGFAKFGQPAGEEVRADVFDGVEPQAVDVGGLDVPASPSVEFGPHLRVGDVDVAAHEVVVVAELVVDVLVPLLSLEEPHPRNSAGFIPVGAVETRPIPGEVGIGAPAAGEFVARPRLDFLDLADGPTAVPRVDGRGAHGFDGFAAHAVVENDVGHHGDARGVQRRNGREVFVFGAVLGGHGAFLIEFPQVVHVVDAVSDVLHPGMPLVGGREPYGTDAAGGQKFGVAGQKPPVARIRSHVPGESLKQKGVDDVGRPLVVCAIVVAHVFGPFTARRSSLT